MTLPPPPPPPRRPPPPLPSLRDLPVEEAIELGRRSIYHATFRDCASGGTVSGEAGAGEGEGGEGWSQPGRQALKG